MIARILRLILIAVVGLAPGTAGADAARAAVAANFTEPATEIGRLFEAASGHTVSFSFGSTGQLYTQIRQGAPFDVLLAADQVRPALLVQDGAAVADSLFTYATGRLVLFSADPNRVTGPESLMDADVQRIAIANPETAPYGAAAVAAMQKLGALPALQSKLVQGNNIAQTYQFVMTGNAALGLVAASQVAGRPGGSHWPVPPDLHPPIAQDAVLLKRGADNSAARSFLAFLRSPAAHAVLTKFGYAHGE